MLIASMLSGGCTLDGGPGPNHRRFAQEARYRAEAEAKGAEEIECPGGCGGTAWLEKAPMVVARDGAQRTVRVATCAHTCREPRRSNPERMQRTRFEIPAKEKVPMARPKPEERYEQERNRFKDALTKTGLSIKQIAEAFEVTYPNVLRWLKEGRGLSPARFERLLSWAARVESGEWVTPDYMKPEAIQAEASRKQWEARRANGAPKPQSFADDRAGTEKAKAEIEAPAPAPPPTANVSPWEAMMAPLLESDLLGVLKARGLALPAGARARVVLEWEGA